MRFQTLSNRVLSDRIEEQVGRLIPQVARVHYSAELRQHLVDFVAAYYGRRLNTLKGLTPYEFICKTCMSQPERFKLNPLQQTPGLNSQALRSTGSSLSGDESGHGSRAG